MNINGQENSFLNTIPPKSNLPIISPELYLCRDKRPLKFFQFLKSGFNLFDMREKQKQELLDLYCPLVK